MKPGALPSNGLAWGWLVTGFLSLFFVISFVDRTIISLLVQPITTEFGASDIQMGLLYGTAFGLAYSLMGLPAAYFIDGGHRKMILVTGVVLWSLSTALCAFVPSYNWLLLCRVGVAVGEAVLSPAAVSMIADLFPRQKRHLPTSVFLTTGILMATGSYFVGGLAMQFAAQLFAPETLDLWRATMLVVGVPGVILGLAFALLVPDPPRLEEVAHPRAEHGFVHYLRAEWRLFVVAILAGGLISVVSFGVIGWLPTVMVREHGFDIAAAGYFVSLVGIPSTILGALGLPMLGAWLERNGWPDALMLLLMLSAASMLCFAFLPWAGSPAMVALCLAPGLIGVTSKISLTTLIVQKSAPGLMRARFMALIMLMTNVAGFGTGPFLVALIAGTWFPGAAGLSAGISVLAIVVTPLAFLAFASALPPYRTLLRTAPA